MLCLCSVRIDRATHIDRSEFHKKQRNTQKSVVNSEHELHNSICFVFIFTACFADLIICYLPFYSVVFIFKMSAMIVGVIRHSIAWLSQCYSNTVQASLNGGVSYIIAVYCLMDECDFFCLLFQLFFLLFEYIYRKWVCRKTKFKPMIIIDVHDRNSRPGKFFLCWMVIDDDIRFKN